MQDSSFYYLAQITISDICNQIEEQDKLGIIEVDFFGDILHITTPDGEYILNRHLAAQEIWLASPVSGPHHFKLDNNRKLFLNKNGQELFKLLDQELNKHAPLSLKVSYEQ